MADREENGRERRLVLRGLGWSGIGFPLGVGLLFLSQVLAANLLSPAEFGDYTLAVSVFMLGALVFQLGLPHSLLRRASQALGRGDEAEARHEIGSAVIVGLGLAFACGAFIGSPVGADLLDPAFPRTAVATVAVLLGIRTGLRILENLVPEGLRAFGDFFRAVLYHGVASNLLFCIALGWLLATSVDSSLEDVLLISVLATAAALVPACFALARR